MGLFRYGAALAALHIDDHELAHLRAVIVAKLRRSEGFLLTGWGSDGNQVSVWMDPAIPMSFQFESSVAVLLDKPKLNQMVEETYRGIGLTIEGPPIDQSDVTAPSDALFSAAMA